LSGFCANPGENPREYRSISRIFNGDWREIGANFAAVILPL
jgi:hypothetical protein